MGVTISYEGKLRGEAAYQELVARVRSFASTRNWPCESIEIHEATLTRTDGDEELTYTGPVRGLVVHPADDCDPLRLEFDQELFFQEFVKTQFAGVETHLAIVELFRLIAPLFGELNVEDDGDYWRTGDRLILEKHFDSVSRVLEETIKKNPKARTKVRLPSGRFVDILE